MLRVRLGRSVSAGSFICAGRLHVIRGSVRIGCAHARATMFRVLYVHHVPLLLARDVITGKVRFGRDVFTGTVRIGVRTRSR